MKKLSKCGQGHPDLTTKVETQPSPRPEGGGPAHSVSQPPLDASWGLSGPWAQPWLVAYSLIQSHAHTLQQALSPFSGEGHNLLTCPGQASARSLLSPCPAAVSPTITQGGPAELISHCSCLMTPNCIAGGLHFNVGKTSRTFKRAISFPLFTSASLSINHPPKMAEWRGSGPEVKGALPWLDPH